MAQDGDSSTEMIHLYRGELGRMTTYRIRLDTTTNWALGGSAAIISYGFGAHAPHYVFALGVVTVLVFAWIESRRFQDLEMIRRRVRCLETGFFAAKLGGEAPEGWREELLASFQHPEPPITLLQSLSVRMRRSYLWLLFTVWGAWMLRLALADEPFLTAAQVGAAPGWLIVAASAIIVFPWIGVAFVHRVGERF